jgi:hypothetical protein
MVQKETIWCCSALIEHHMCCLLQMQPPLATTAWLHPHHLHLVPPLPPLPVAQASFDPPGITIAVKKDRGMETMLQPGNAFAVSMVPESQEKPIMKVRRQAPRDSFCTTGFVHLL